MNTKQLASGMAVVTGAAGGMGSAVAKQMAEAGWQDLLLIDLDAGRLEAVAAPLRTSGARVEILAGDIADPQWPAQFLAKLGDRPIGAVVHTAGISPGMGAAALILAINLDATVRLVDAIRPRMTEGSAAVLFASNSSYFPMPPEAAAAFCKPLPPEGTAALAHLAPTPESAYPLSKLAVRALVKREAKAFGQRGARIVSMSPGAIDTSMGRGALTTSEIARKMIEGGAIPRMGHPEELAAVAVFLCSPAAGFVTACDILVDGGQTAAMGF